MSKELGGTKHDQGKPDLTLMPIAALNEISKAFMYGEAKYSSIDIGLIEWINQNQSTVQIIAIEKLKPRGFAILATKNTESQKTSGTNCWKTKAENALYALEKQNSTPIIATKLELCEEYFVVAATTASDFLTIVSKVLKEQSNISVSLNRFLISGRANYRKGFLWLRLAAATLRHMYAWIWGEDKDPESSLSHLAHAGASLCMLIDLVVNNLGQDNRTY